VSQCSLGDLMSVELMTWPLVQSIIMERKLRCMTFNHTRTRRWLTVIGAIMCIPTMALSWILLLKSSGELFDPWDMAAPFLPPPGTFTRTLRDSLRVVAPVAVTVAMLISIVLLVRALRRAPWQPAIPFSVLLIQGLLGWGILYCYRLIPSAPPSYARNTLAMLGFAILLVLALAVQGMSLRWTTVGRRHRPTPGGRRAGR
jgi:hypothetical protein